MKMNPLFQIQLEQPDAHEWGVIETRPHKDVNHTEKVRNRKRRAEHISYVKKVGHVPKRLIHDIVTFSPEALKCARGEECPYSYEQPA